MRYFAIFEAFFGQTCEMRRYCTNIHGIYGRQLEEKNLMKQKFQSNTA